MILNGGAALAEAHDGTGTVGTLTASTAITVAGGTLLVITQASYLNDITGCSDTVNGAYTTLGSSGTAQSYQVTYYKVTTGSTPASTVVSCTVSNTSGAGSSALTVSAYSGVDPVSPLETGSVSANAITSTGGTALGPVTAANAGDLVYYGMSNSVNVGVTEDAAYSQISNYGNYQDYHSGYKIAGAGGSFSPTPVFGANGNYLSYTAAVFKAYTGGGGGGGSAVPSIGRRGASKGSSAASIGGPWGIFVP